MTTINFDNLPGPLAEAARTVSLRLSQAGFQAWIVGGAVRDLVLEKAPKDVDIATDALPDEVEALFIKTSAVGKAFGTIVVHLPRRELSSEAQALAGESSGVDIEVTTFRSDGEYLDGRRPEIVVYADNLEEDASRRDFTCNALFADVLTGRLMDPEGGLPDLQAGRLRAVGIPRDRFTEDGLRLMRLARFEARFGLEPAIETLEGARFANQTIRGVSPERIRMELDGMFACVDPARAMRRLHDLGLFELIFEAGEGQSSVSWKVRSELFDTQTVPAQKLICGLALLLGPRPDSLGYQEALSWSELRLNYLKPSKGVVRSVLGIWETLAQFLALAEKTHPGRCARIMVMRAPGWVGTAWMLKAWAASNGTDQGMQIRLSLAEALEQERQSLKPEELEPAPLITPKDLAATTIERGPRWGRLLKEAAELQLDLELNSRDDALRWLQARASAGES